MDEAASAKGARGRAYWVGFRDWILGQIVANLFAVLFLICGVWVFTITLLRWIPMPGTTDQPASVQSTGMDLASMRHIIFEAESWWTPPPSPPPPVR